MKDKIDLIFSDLKNECITEKEAHHKVLNLVDQFRPKWQELRDKFFAECVKNDSTDGYMVKIDYAPHDLFEWFKRNIAPQVSPELDK